MTSPTPPNDWITLAAGDATAAISPTLGAELMSWRVGGEERVWHGAMPHWNRRAPILFPIVGAAAGGVVRVEGRPYPMAQHGFARDTAFSVIDRGEASATFRLAASEATRRHYPFDFSLDVTYTLTSQALRLDFAIQNRDAARLPYAIGFHPAFPWPFDGGAKEDYRVVFDAAETPEVPVIAPGGLISREMRPIALEGHVLSLDPEAFTEALCFIGAKSRAMRFLAPSGRAIAMRVENFPHLALWTKPRAPFLSLECWSGHADVAGSEIELAARNTITLLAPGAVGRHAVTLAFEDD